MYLFKSPNKKCEKIMHELIINKENFLTDVKFESLLDEAMTAASRLVMLLKNKNTLAGLGKDCGRSQSTNTTADHNRVQISWDQFCLKSWSNTRSMLLGINNEIFNSM